LCVAFSGGGFVSRRLTAGCEQKRGKTHRSCGLFRSRSFSPRGNQHLVGSPLVGN
jgi:hypothetical protein